MRWNKMCCKRCGKDGVFDVTCTTRTKVYRRKECRECRNYSRRQHATIVNTLATLATPRPKECQCCGKEGKLVVDHCHTTGCYRGVICGQCNKALGALGDTEASLLRALQYLVQPPQLFVPRLN